MRTTLMLFMLMLYGTCISQKLKGSFGASLINGNAEHDVQVTAGLHLKKKQYTIGILTGVDGYRFRSVPVMLSSTFAFSKKHTKPYLFANGGLNIASVSDKQRVMHWDAVSPTDYRSGYILEGGAGYRLELNKERSLNFSLGYSFKTIGEKYDFLQWNGIMNVRDTKTLTYRMRRIAISCSISF